MIQNRTKQHTSDTRTQNKTEHHKTYKIRQHKNTTNTATRLPEFAHGSATALPNTKKNGWCTDVHWYHAAEKHTTTNRTQQTHMRNQTKIINQKNTTETTRRQRETQSSKTNIWNWRTNRQQCGAQHIQNWHDKRRSYSGRRNKKHKTNHLDIRLFKRRNFQRLDVHMIVIKCTAWHLVYKVRLLSSDYQKKSPFECSLLIGWGGPRVV